MFRTPLRGLRRRAGCPFAMRPEGDVFSWINCHWRPYTGVIDWDDFSNALTEIGFDGSMSLETYVPHSVPNGPEREAEEDKLFRDACRIAKR